MARKSNLRGNGPEKNASVDIVASPESADTPFKKKGLKPETSVISESSGFNKENGQNSECRGKQNGSSRNKSHKGGGSENGKKGSGHTDANTNKGRPAMSRGSGAKAPYSMSKGVSSSGEVGGREPVANSDGSTVGEPVEHVERMTNVESCGPDIATQSTSSSHSGIEENIVNGISGSSEHTNGNEDRKIRVSQAYIWFKQASEWIQQQKPILIALSASAFQAKDFVISWVHHTWPIVSSWLLHFGKLSLLFLVLWLDCSLRGLGSVIRLGTTSFFVVIWCSFLSVIAMAGFFSVLLSLAAVCVVAFFVGYTAAISITAVLGALVLWMHGSFWMTGSVMIIAGIIFALNREHIALLITILYSIYCAKCHVGWLGIIISMNLAFISGDILIYILKSGANESKGKGFAQQTGATNGGTRSSANGSGFGGSSEQGNFASYRSFGESSQSSQSVDSHASPSTSGLGGGDLTSEEEVIRLLDSPDHYAVLGFSRYDNIDVAVLKREYRKKAMLVHPDKNMGNVKAEEAFKKLQNAYEVLLDSVKRKVYDEDLRREELISYFRRFQSGAQRNGRYGPFKHGYGNFEDNGGEHPPESRRITCKKCNGSHVWIQTERTKSQARWCQECQDYHQAKDGDGWVEQSGQSFLFGMLRKVDVPHAYACVEGKIYDATEWLVCQGMKCPPNTHKPTFHVNTTMAGKNTGRGGGSTYKAGTSGGVPTNLEENMTEEEFFEWLQNAVASGMFDNGSGVPENAGTKSGNHAKNNKKKRKGKKQCSAYDVA
ncbi:uncharacterized protein LOC131044885 isoform X1 [Cryptomeria japonica]|uniref:uncharacterized protein LOC131044885 isoform X1 n=1 Tax=Cryptomeria japonica TaxID=3369 RepID=UPI0027DA2211|nr:uncharacterized protein LOC131044885 isoform X1 [Cryptomeria japonica]